MSPGQGEVGGADMGLSGLQGGGRCRVAKGVRCKALRGAAWGQDPTTTRCIGMVGDRP